MAGIQSLSELKQFSNQLPEQDQLMPVLFVGHGSPMNGIEDNTFSQRWKKMGEDIPVPTAVLVVSAHWFTRGTRITAMDFPKTIHDFGGFPEELYQVKYPAPGDKILAETTVSMIQSTEVVLDHDWGLDHGTWTIVRHMYPLANIPVLQLSIDYTKSPNFHYELAHEMFSLRKKGVLIIGSGNMVHNLRMISWDKLNGNHNSLIQYQQMGKDAMMAIPTPEHYLPLLYILGLQSKKDQVDFFNDQPVGGSITMTSVKFSVLQ